MSLSPTTEDTNASRSLTPTTSSSSTCTTSLTSDTTIMTQIEISVTATTELQNAKEGLSSPSTLPTPSSAIYEISPSPTPNDPENSQYEEKLRSFDEEVVKYTFEGPYDDEDDDDDTLSSEAMVDDIELILMPEETMEIPEVQSPKLVRVRELDDNGHLLQYDDDEDDDCNFRKMDGSERIELRRFSADDGSDDGEPITDEAEGAVGFTNLSFCQNSEGGDDEDISYASSTTSSKDPRAYNRKSLASSGVQTEITALDTGIRQPIIGDYRFGSGGRKVMTSSSGKKLNWKSEMTLLPSKTKLGHHYHRGLGDGGLMSTADSISFSRDEDERDQYSAGCRVAKFTSQDNVLSSSSQFLKPSTLYRTRNLSRNLNQLGSSETSFILPETGSIGLGSHTSRYRAECSSQLPPKGITSTGTHSRRPGTSKSFRSSLPDLTPGIGENAKCLAARRRQSHQYSRVLRPSHSGGGHGAPFGSAGLRKCRKKSSSDDETSSLIDESERCLRSSIDLLLTDDIPPPGYDYPYYSGSSSVGLGRRYCSQPILTEEAYFYREPRNKSMGSPFLPRRMSDIRCSKFAKVILPDGQVSVVSIIDIDETRDTLQVLPDSGTPIIIPFRKVVFAWRNSRR